jgi:hypothetical protein
MRSRHLFGRGTVSAPGMYPNTPMQRHADEHAEVRGELRGAMQEPKNTDRYLGAQAEHARVSDQVYATSDGRAYGSGTHHDRRGHRDLHEHFDTKPSGYRGPYSGPSSYRGTEPPEPGVEHEYQPTKARMNYPESTTGNRIEPSWNNNDCLPAHDYSSDTGRRRR